MTFTLIAHRGYSDLAPENTLAAFDLALERGFPQLELDVQLTRDGVPVVIHDDHLDRTTDGTGPLRMHTFDEVHALSAGRWFAAPTLDDTARFATERVPSFEEVLRRYAGRAHINVELKSPEQELAEVVAPLFARCGWDTSRVSAGVPGLTITSFHVEQLHRSYRLLPALPHGWLLTRITEADLDLCAILGLAEICPRADTLTVDAVRAATARGLEVRAWGVRSEPDLLTAARSGAAGATVNWPARAAEALKRLEG